MGLFILIWTIQLHFLLHLLIITLNVQSLVLVLYFAFLIFYFIYLYHLFLSILPLLSFHILAKIFNFPYQLALSNHQDLCFLLRLVLTLPVVVSYHLLLSDFVIIIILLIFIYQLQHLKISILAIPLRLIFPSFLFAITFIFLRFLSDSMFKILIVFTFLFAINLVLCLVNLILHSIQLNLK